MDQPTALAAPPPRPSAAMLCGALGAVAAALVAVSFRVPLGWMYDRWMEGNSYYTHGPLVPLVAAYFIWTDRANIMAEAPRRSMLGLAAMLTGLAVLVVSGFMSIFFSAGFALILTLWGLAGFVLGPHALRRLLLPAFLLLFMVPLPEAMILRISFWMKMAVTSATLKFMNLIGIASVNDGATILLGDAAVTVGDACSGLRSMISLLFLGVLFAAAGELPPLRRGVLFLASAPIAFLANIMRVFFLCLIAYHWGEGSINAPVGIGPVAASPHDISGYLIFVVAFALLFGVLRLLTPRGRNQAEQPAPAARPAFGFDSGVAARLCGALVALGLAGTASASVLYPSVMSTGNLQTAKIPAEHGGWSGIDLPIDATVTQMLETDDVIQRNYFNVLFGARPVQLAVVYSGNNRRVAHPPEICYTAAGWEVMATETVREPGIPPMIRMTMHHGQRKNVVMYCFKAGPLFTEKYNRQQWNIVTNLLRGQSTSSALIRISSMVHDNESVEDAKARGLAFAKELFPEVERALP